MILIKVDFPAPFHRPFLYKHPKPSSLVNNIAINQQIHSLQDRVWIDMQKGGNLVGGRNLHLFREIRMSIHLFKRSNEPRNGVTVHTLTGRSQ